MHLYDALKLPQILFCFCLCIQNTFGQQSTISWKAPYLNFTRNSITTTSYMFTNVTDGAMFGTSNEVIVAIYNELTITSAACTASYNSVSIPVTGIVSGVSTDNSMKTFKFKLGDFAMYKTIPLVLTCGNIVNQPLALSQPARVYIEIYSGTTQLYRTNHDAITPFTTFVFGKAGTTDLSPVSITPSTLMLSLTSSNNVLMRVDGLVGYGPGLSVAANDRIVLQFPTAWSQLDVQPEVRLFVNGVRLLDCTASRCIVTSFTNSLILTVADLTVPNHAMSTEDVAARMSLEILSYGAPLRVIPAGTLYIYTTANPNGKLEVVLPRLLPNNQGAATLSHATRMVDTWGTQTAQITAPTNIEIQPNDVFGVLLPGTGPGPTGPWRWKKLDSGAIIDAFSNTYTEIKCSCDVYSVIGTVHTWENSYSDTFAINQELMNRSTRFRLVTIGNDVWIEFQFPDLYQKKRISAKMSCSGVATPSVGTSASFTKAHFAVLQSTSPSDFSLPIAFLEAEQVSFSGIIPKSPTLGSPILTLTPNLMGSSAVLQINYNAWTSTTFLNSFYHTIHLPVGFLTTDTTCKIKLGSDNDVDGVKFNLTTTEYIPGGNILKLQFPTTRTESNRPTSLSMTCLNVKIPMYMTPKTTTLGSQISVMGDVQRTQRAGVEVVIPEEFFVAQSNTGTLEKVLSLYTSGERYAEIALKNTYNASSVIIAGQDMFDFHAKISPLISSHVSVLKANFSLEIQVPASGYDPLSQCSIKIGTTASAIVPDVTFQFQVTSPLEDDAPKKFMRVRALFRSDFDLPTTVSDRLLEFKCTHMIANNYGHDDGYHSMYVLNNEVARPVVPDTMLWTSLIQPRTFLLARANIGRTTVLVNSPVIMTFTFQSVSQIQPNQVGMSNYYHMRVDLGYQFSSQSLYAVRCFRGITIDNTTSFFDVHATKTYDYRSEFTFPLANLVTGNEAIAASKDVQFSCVSIVSPKTVMLTTSVSLAIVMGPRFDIFLRNPSIALARVDPRPLPTPGAVITDMGGIKREFGISSTGFKLDLKPMPTMDIGGSSNIGLAVVIPVKDFQVTVTQSFSSTFTIEKQAGNDDSVGNVRFVNFNENGNVTLVYIPAKTLSLDATTLLTLDVRTTMKPLIFRETQNMVVRVMRVNVDGSTAVLHSIDTVYAAASEYLKFGSSSASVQFVPDSIGSVSSMLAKFTQTGGGANSLVGNNLFLMVPPGTVRNPTASNSDIHCMQGNEDWSTNVTLTKVEFQTPYKHISFRDFRPSTSTDAAVIQIMCTNIKAPSVFDSFKLLVVSEDATTGDERARNYAVDFAGMGARVLESPRTIDVYPKFIHDAQLSPNAVYNLTINLEPFPFKILPGDYFLFDLHHSISLNSNSRTFINNVAVTQSGFIAGDGSGEQGSNPVPDNDDGGTDTGDHNLPPDPGDFLPLAVKSRFHKNKPMREHVNIQAAPQRSLLNMTVPTDFNYVVGTSVQVNVTNIVPPTSTVMNSIDYQINLYRTVNGAAKVVAYTNHAIWGGVLPLFLGTTSYSIDVSNPSSMGLSNVDITVSPLPADFTSDMLFDQVVPKSYDLVFSNTNSIPTTCVAVRLESRTGSNTESNPTFVSFSNAEVTMNTIGATSVATVDTYTIHTFSVRQATLSRTQTTGYLKISCNNVRMPKLPHASVSVGLGMRPKVSSFKRKEEEPYAEAFQVGTLNTTTIPFIDISSYSYFASTPTMPEVSYSVIGSVYGYLMTSSRVIGQSSALSIFFRPLPVPILKGNVMKVIIPVGGWLITTAPICKFFYYSPLRAEYYNFTVSNSHELSSSRFTLTLTFDTEGTNIYFTHVSKVICENINLPTQPIASERTNVAVEVYHDASPTSKFMQNHAFRLHPTIAGVEDLQNVHTYLTQTVILYNTKTMSKTGFESLGTSLDTSLSNVGVRGTEPLQYNVKMVEKDLHVTYLFKKSNSYNVDEAELLSTLVVQFEQLEKTLVNSFKFTNGLQLGSQGVLDVEEDCHASKLLGTTSRCGFIISSVSQICSTNGAMQCPAAAPTQTSYYNAASRPLELVSVLVTVFITVMIFL